MSQLSPARERLLRYVNLAAIIAILATLVKCWTLIHRIYLNNLKFFNAGAKTGIYRTPGELNAYWWDEFMLPGLIFTTIAVNAILLINWRVFKTNRGNGLMFLFMLEIILILLLAPIIFSF